MSESIPDERGYVHIKFLPGDKVSNGISFLVCNDLPIHLASHLIGASKAGFNNPARFFCAIIAYCLDISYNSLYRDSVGITYLQPYLTFFCINSLVDHKLCLPTTEL